MSLETLFQLKKNGTSVRVEILAGVTTFATMAYIIFVQPVVLAEAGLDQGAVFTSTCLAVAFSSILMALLANYPVAGAPAMGHNFFFSFTVVLAMGIPWRIALGAIFISGVIFVLTASFRFRENRRSGSRIAQVIDSGGNRVADHAHRFEVGRSRSPGCEHVRRPGRSWRQTGHRMSVRARADGDTSGAWHPWSNSVRHRRRHSNRNSHRCRESAVVGGQSAPSIEPTLFELDIIGALSHNLVAVIFVFFFLDLFDTVGSLIGISKQAGFMKDGQLPRAGRALLADAIGTVGAAATGNTTMVSYIESASGVAVGGRTELTAIVTGSLFLWRCSFLRSSPRSAAVSP